MPAEGDQISQQQKPDAGPVITLSGVDKNVNILDIQDPSATTSAATTFMPPPLPVVSPQVGGQQEEEALASSGVNESLLLDGEGG